MANDILNSLLKEYNAKKLQAELDLVERKRLLFLKIPRLQLIEDELNSAGFLAAKSIFKNPSFSIQDLKYKIDILKLEKYKILEEHNIDYKYLKPFYECEKCNDSGYITSNNTKSEMCSCLRQKLLNISFNKSNISNLEKENFSKFNINYFSDEVDLSKYKYNFSPKTNIINIKKNVHTFIDNFNSPSLKNLFFSGNTGCGKTFMTNCIAYELLNKGKTVLYQTAPILLDSIINNKMSRDKNSYDDIYKQALDVDLLIIDDLGTEVLNSMRLSELFTIINSRILSSKKTIISSNLSIKDIFNTYEERIASRIVGHYDLYHFFGDDIRFKINKKM